MGDARYCRILLQLRTYRILHLEAASIRIDHMSHRHPEAGYVYTAGIQALREDILNNQGAKLMHSRYQFCNQNANLVLV